MSRAKIINYSVIAVLLAAAIGFSVYVSQIGSLPQASYALFQHLAKPTAADRILVLSPHQDDEALGAGGYLVEAVKAGAAVEVAFATDGNKHGLKDARRTEAKTAETALGISESQLIFFDFPDGQLSANQTALETRLNGEVQKFKPTIILTTLPADDHPDHAAAGQAVQAEVKSHPEIQADYFLIHFDRYPRPIGYKPTRYLLPPPELVNPDYDWFVFDLSADDLATKSKAIASYKSQLSIRNPILRQLLYSFERPNELFAQIH